MRTLFKTFLITTLFFIAVQKVGAHCQIPCGIYDDHMRINMMLEDAKTIEKSVNELIGHGKDDDIQSKNQMVRWVINKEKFADKIIFTLTDYFLTQRIKSSSKTYVDQLKAAHAIMIMAVTCKQTVDKKAVESLQKAIKAFEVYYPEPKHSH